jgi:hypothetical protein
VCVVRMRSLLGWMTVMAVELVGLDVVVKGMTSDFEAAVSMNAVEDRSGGLSQPGSRAKKVAIALQATSMSDKPAGANRLVAGAQLMFLPLPQLMSDPMAVEMWPSAR